MKKIILLSLFSLFYYTNLASEIVLVESKEQFNALPSIAYDAFEYLSNPVRDAIISRFIFVRHGESVGNKEKIMAGRTCDVDLTDEGVEQALIVRDKFKEIGISFDAAYSSPSLRAKRTANLIVDILPYLDDRLYEKYYGPYEGANEKEYAFVKELEKTTLFNSFEEKFSFKAHPEMESLVDVYNRTLNFLEDVNLKHKGQTVLIATHAGVMKALFMADLVKKGWEIEYRSFDLGNTSVLVVEIKDEDFQVKACSHLNFRN